MVYIEFPLAVNRAPLSWEDEIMTLATNEIEMNVPEKLRCELKSTKLKAMFP